MEYDFERHVKKFGPINKDTLLHMLFFRIVFTIGKNDFTIKAYLKKLKDTHCVEYIGPMQSFNEMAPVADKFILEIVANDERHGEEKMRKRAASLVQATPMRSQIRMPTEQEAGVTDEDAVGGVKAK